MQPGQRIQYLEEFGTVRYYGPLLHKPSADKSEMWACIEWDMPYRGKHNGTVEGYTYYQSATGDSSCSLVRADKLARGCTISEACLARYKNLSAESMEEINRLYVFTGKKKKKLIEMIGMDKAIQKIENGYTLLVVALQKCGVSQIDSGFQALMPKVTFLYLEQNLLWSWSQFFQLAQIPTLYFLSLTNNRLQFPSSTELSDALAIGISSKLQVLVFIGMNLVWEDVNKLLPCMPYVEELWLCRNKCSAISSKYKVTIAHLARLKLLNLEDNQISDWNELNEFASLPNLEKLILNQNPLKDIKYYSGFKTLKSISLDRCMLNSFIPLNYLNMMPSLEKIRFSNNPISDSVGDRKCRYNVIARIKNLKNVNGSVVKEVERKDCELGYLKDAYEQYIKLEQKQDMEQFMLANHPRWNELIKRHGAPVEMYNKKIDVMKGSMNVNAMNFLFQLKSDKEKVISKKVPLSLTVRGLKGLCSKLFNLSITEMKIFCKSLSSYTELSDDLKLLSFYQLEEGSDMIIEKI